jgi:hypothetical protein
MMCLGILLAPIVGMAEERSDSTSSSAQRTDCRYVTNSKDSDASENGSFRSVGLPDDDVFRPLLADPKEPQFIASYQHVRFRNAGESLNVAAVGFGGSFGLWGLRQEKNCDGLQVNIFGAVFPQFNLDASSSDLINSDFLIGFPITFRRGSFSTRLHVLHQSSHVGDEFLLNNPGFNRVNLSFEMVDVLFSFESSWWRIYGGGGYLISPEPDLDQGALQWGVELRAAPRVAPIFGKLMDGLFMAPVLGADFRSIEELGWNTNTSIQGGLNGFTYPVNAGSDSS